MRIALFLALAALAPAAACGGGGAATETAPLEVEGVVVGVAEEDGRIVSFEVEDAGGTVEIFVAGDVDYGFDLAHLKEHEATGEPVRCALEERDGRLVALSIVDA